VFWLILASMVFETALSLILVCTHFGTLVLSVVYTVEWQDVSLMCVCVILITQVGTDLDTALIRDNTFHIFTSEFPEIY